MSKDGVICINNILNTEYAGKGKLAIPYLEEHNYKVDRLRDECAILTRKTPKNVDLKITEEVSEDDKKKTQ